MSIERPGSRDLDDTLAPLADPARRDPLGAFEAHAERRRGPRR